MKIPSYNYPVFSLVRLTDKIGMKLVRLSDTKNLVEYLFSTDNTLSVEQNDNKFWYDDLSNQEIYDIVMLFTTDNEEFINKYKLSIDIKDSIVALIKILNKRNENESTRTNIQKII